MREPIADWKWGILCCPECGQVSIVVLPDDERFAECPICDRITRPSVRRISTATLLYIDKPKQQELYAA